MSSFISNVIESFCSCVKVESFKRRLSRCPNTWLIESVLIFSIRNKSLYGEPYISNIWFWLSLIYFTSESCVKTQATLGSLPTAGTITLGKKSSSEAFGNLNVNLPFITTAESRYVLSRYSVIYI